MTGKGFFLKIASSLQVSISYSASRRIHIPIRRPLPSFPIETDPSRFYSYHCMLFPETRFCAALYPRDEEHDDEEEDEDP